MSTQLKPGRQDAQLGMLASLLHRIDHEHQRIAGWFFVICAAVAALAVLPAFFLDLLTPMVLCAQLAFAVALLGMFAAVGARLADAVAAVLTQRWDEIRPNRLSPT